MIFITLGLVKFAVLSFRNGPVRTHYPIPSASHRDKSDYREDSVIVIHNSSETVGLNREAIECKTGYVHA